MKRTQRGNHREVKVGQHLEERGWVVGSRRHIGGAGDLLAVQSATRRVWLIEVKSTADGPWRNFGPQDRMALIETARKIEADPVMAWWPPGGSLQWIHEKEFPPCR